MLPIRCANFNLLVEKFGILSKSNLSVNSKNTMLFSVLLKKLKDLME